MKSASAADPALDAEGLAPIPSAGRAEGRSAETPSRTPRVRSLRPRRLPRPAKARCAQECHSLEQLPNIGPSLADDLRLLGVQHPVDLKSRDAFALYQALCERTGQRQDPCVLDTFMAVVDFMQGASPRPWWTYTAQRKQQFGSV